jgi:hypothetical protein
MEYICFPLTLFLRDYLEDQEIGGWIILRWISEREDRMVWTGFIWLGRRAKRWLL